MCPILFKIGPVTIRAYGLMVAMATSLAFFLLYREARKKNFYADKILDLELLILLSGILGARTLHVLVNLDFYKNNPIDIFFIWRGGLAFYGALILAFLASCVFILRKKMPFWKTADFVAPYIALGQAIGRIGCFLNGCCYGAPTTLKLFGVTFPGDSVARHPTQLYASLALFCIFLILKFAREKNIQNGAVFGLYLLLYSLQRFCIDFLRADTPRFILNLTVSQVISLVIFVIAIFVLKHGRTKIYS